MSIEELSFKRRSSQRWSQKNKDKFVVGNIHSMERTGKGFRGIEKKDYSKRLEKAIIKAL